MYANLHAMRLHENLPECAVTPLPPHTGDGIHRYNFRLGTLVNAVEYDVQSSDVAQVLSSKGLVMSLRSSALSFLGSQFDWEVSGKPMTDAMAITS